MIRWQYTTLTYAWDEEKKDLVWGNTKELVVNAETVDKRLNELGKEGWELLCIEKLSDVSHIAVNFYLKRPKEAGNQRPLEAPTSKLLSKTSVEQTSV